MTVASDPINFRLYTGNSKSVDVDRDGYDDLIITLQSIISGQAQFSFRAITNATQNVGTTTGNDSTATPSTTTGTASYTWWIVAGVIALLATSAGFWLAHHKRTTQLMYP